LIASGLGGRFEVGGRERDRNLQKARHPVEEHGKAHGAEFVVVDLPIRQIGGSARAGRRKRRRSGSQAETAQ
jgi:hypothetical protein